MTDPHEDDQRVDLLRRAAEVVSVGPLHTDHLVATAHRLRRRRAGVLAAAAVLVVAGGTAAVGLTRDDPSRSKDDDPVVQPAPTVDTRLVGVGRLAVEVPAEWASGKVECAGPSVSKPTVFAGVSGRDCLVTEPAPYVAVIDISFRPFDDNPPPGMAHVEIPGGDALISKEPWMTDSGLVAMTLSEESSGYLQVATHSEAETRAIVESARIVPADQIAVPWTPAAIEAAGLVVEEVPVDTGGQFSDGYVLGTKPGGGSVVPVGSKVRVRVAQSIDWPGFMTGPAISCVYNYPEDLPARGEAVAGTVTDVRVGRYLADEGELHAEVTVAVDEWFRGGPGPTVVLNTFTAMLPDDPQDAVGVQILAAFGPAHDLMACGFTRPWDEKTARQWRDSD